MTGVLGRAFIQVFADLSKFTPDLREKIKTALDEHTKDLPMEELDKSAVKAGEKAADDLADSTKKRLDTRMKEVGDRFEAGFVKAVKGAGTAIVAAFIPTLIALAVEGVAALAPLVTALAGVIPAAATSAIAVLSVLKMATNGVGSALKDAFDPKKAAQFNEEMKKLAPAARDFVHEVQAVHPLMKTLQQDVQQTFFVQFHGALTTMVRSLFPQVRAGLHAISADLGQIVNGVLRQLAGSRSQISVIFTDAHKALLPLIPLIGEFAHAMLVIGAAASPLVNMLSAGFADLIRQFTGFIATESRAGGLAQFFQDAVVIMHQFGQLLGNVWGLLMQIIGALQQTGAQGLGVLSRLVGMLSDFFGTAQGHQLLISLFNLLNVALQTLGTVLPPLLPGLSKLITLLANGLAAALITLTPYLEKITNFLGQHPALLAAAAGAWAAYRIALIGVAIAEAVVDALNPVGLIVLAIAAIVAGAILIASQWKTIEHAAKVAWGAVVRFFEGIWEKIKSIGESIGHFFTSTLPDFFMSLPTKIGNALAAIPGLLWSLFLGALHLAGEAIGIGVGLIIAWFVKVPLLIWDALKALGHLIKDIFTIGLNAAIDFIKFNIDAIVWIFTKLPGKIWDGINALPGILGKAFRAAWDWVKRETVAGTEAVINFVWNLPKRIAGFMGRVGSDILGGLKAGINAVISGFNSGIDKVSGFIHIGLPHLPLLAAGGLINRPTLAVVGEAGPEAVVPMKDPSTAADVARKTGLLDILGSRMSNVGATVVHVYLGTREIVDILDQRVEHALDGQALALANGPR